VVRRANVTGSGPWHHDFAVGATSRRSRRTNAIVAQLTRNAKPLRRSLSPDAQLPALARLPVETVAGLADREPRESASEPAQLLRDTLHTAAKLPAPRRLTPSLETG
jgi:hypothetical protein